MTKPRRDVWLAIEEAQSALAILSTLLEDKLDAHSRKEMDKLLGKARAALDKAQNALTDRLQELQAALDRI